MPGVNATKFCFGKRSATSAAAISFTAQSRRSHEPLAVSFEARISRSWRVAASAVFDPLEQVAHIGDRNVIVRQGDRDPGEDHVAPPYNRLGASSCSRQDRPPATTLRTRTRAPLDCSRRRETAALAGENARAPQRTGRELTSCRRHTQGERRLRTVTAHLRQHWLRALILAARDTLLLLSLHPRRLTKGGRVLQGFLSLSCGLIRALRLLPLVYLCAPPGLVARSG